MMNIMKRLVKEEEGQGMVEYSLIIALIAIALIGVVGSLAGSDGQSGIGKAFNTISTALNPPPAGQ